MKNESNSIKVNSIRPQFDLAVCYRVYPRISGNPIFDFTDKLDLVRLNLESFKAAMGSLKIKIYVLLDNCPHTYQKLFESCFADVNLEFVALQGEGNGATFSRQIDLLIGQEASDLVYFAEDDYLYVPDALEHAVSFMGRHSDVDFLTLYDHRDYYHKYIHQFSPRDYRQEETLWRTVASTCLTFMTRRQTLGTMAETLRSFMRGNSDLGLWLSITKQHIFSPWTFLHSIKDGLFVPASIALAWRHAWRQIVFGHRHALWSPVPSLATHMERGGVAPCVDWQTLFDERACAIRRENEEKTTHVHGRY